MKKTMGKALSLVLSLAMVVSSFSATFANAATASETATIKLTSDNYYLCNGSVTGNSAKLVSPDLKTALSVSSGELSDHSICSNLALKDVVITSGSNLVTLAAPKNTTTGEVNSVNLTLANKDVVGTVTLAARYEGTVQRGVSTENTNVYANATMTVNILKEGQTYIVKGAVDTDATAADTVGSMPASLDPLAKNVDAGNTIYGRVVTVGQNGSTDCSAKWTNQEVAADATAAADMAANQYMISYAGAKVATGNGTVVGAKYYSFSITPSANTSVAGVSVSAQKYTGASAPATDPSAKAAVSTAVANKISAPSGDKVISEYQGVTYLFTDAIDGTTGKTPTTAGVINVTGCDIDFAHVGANDVTMQGGTVGNITGAPQAITISDGSVGDIVEAVDNVTVTKGVVKSITATLASGKAVTINGGTIGDISVGGNTTGTSLVIQPTSETVPITTGNITLKAAIPTVTIDSHSKAAVATGNIKLAADNTTVTLTGDKVTVGTIDADYRIASVKLDDFKGTIAAPINTYTQGVSGTSKALTLTAKQTAGTTDATVTGAPFINAVTLTAGTLTFADSATIGAGGITGAGVLKFAPGAIYTKGVISGVKVELTKDFKVGDTVFTADTGKAYVGSFTPVGFTVEKVAASSTIDAFQVKTMVFAGIKINGSDKVALNTTEDYTADCNPTGTALPAGDTIKWSFSGNSNYLTAKFDGNKASVTAVKEDTTFASLNHGTLTAMVVDSLGFQDYAYAPATFDVAIGTKPITVTFKSDTNNNFDVAQGGAYTFKITSNDGKEHAIVAGSSSFAVSKVGASANDTFYKITSVGKVGDKCGIYVDGKKLLVVTTKASAGAKLDTGAALTLKAGKTYCFKATFGSKVAFGVGNSKVITGSAVKQVGNDYFFTIKGVGKAGDKAGVYVNGVRMTIVTIA